MLCPDSNHHSYVHRYIIKEKATLVMCDSNTFFLCDATYTFGSRNFINVCNVSKTD